MKKYNLLGSLFSAGALLFVGCTDPSTGGDKPNTLPPGDADGGLEMGVTMSGLTSDQSFCMSWSLYQDDGQGGWYLIDQREEPVCGDPGDLALTDFATCYDGKHFLVQYEISLRDANGDEVASATATSGGGPGDVCVKNVDTPTNANIQFNQEGNAGGVNPGFDIDRVCSNNKLVEENGEIVSAFWIQPDNCELPGSPDSFCMLASGEGLETARTGITADGSTRFIFNTAAKDAAWDLIYMSPEDSTASELTLVHSPFALHHSSDGQGNLVKEELTALGAFQLGKTMGLVRVEGEKLIITSSDNVTCDSAVDLSSPSSTQEIALPDGSSAIGVVATGSSSFDVIYSLNGDILSTSCDANAAPGSMCL